MSDTREVVSHARSVVVKIGSSAITSLVGGLDRGRLDRLVDAIEARIRTGSSVIVVSSGAVGAGLAPLGLTSRPRDLATKQAAASVGQLTLAHAWGTSFARYDRTVGQVLLTADDIGRRTQHRNAQRTLDRLRSLGAVPVVNENDTVATVELRFGDNDRLAALVAHLIGADALILLSDVDGLYDGDPRKGSANLIPEVRTPEDLDGVVAGSGGALGTGGMASKLSAARLAADSGVPVLLAAASQADRALGAADVGTAFAARPQRLSARRFWVRHAADVHGSLYLDEGAVRAVMERRRSLLAAGITGTSGGFHAGDVVGIVAPDGRTVARGVVAYDASELDFMIGFSTGQLPPDLQRPVVHADDLVRVV
ncbi:glutamate 5-kinase [Rhodococcus pyridinivorans]|uniref:Glutamate 5-kinase n=4 Tax=Rhodococcus TaxID=1827 RepID=V9XBC7_9NOCA|nr:MULTISPECIES: glutamate 5-kinase [Rhodococcus]AHD19334.1 gamma-glutamyl kinase [Rhodococcus pyridinivorans SB3094]AOD22704.1 glutamate 5-kinase [Rhodococcus sp. p52]APE08714.1 glutamate 5-kinase [Rhodococcus sp. 2G]AWZ24708.1 glutamate 5-kinase [Rhodococcus pyridinivorans]EHK84979.1 gamma-glutamyl kinase [Rhodococcus pyridinivorans AK37]